MYNMYSIKVSQGKRQDMAILLSAKLGRAIETSQTGSESP